LTCTDFEEDHGRGRSQLGEQRDEGGREALRGGLGERLDAVPDGDAG
jgi:hypothetical protein